MNSMTENPFVSLNLSEEVGNRVLAVIRAQVDVAKQMRRLVLCLVLVIIAGFAFTELRQASPARSADVEHAMNTFMKCAAWVFAGMSTLAMVVYQIRLQHLHRVAEALPIEADKRKLITNLTNDAMSRAIFGYYGYRFIGRFFGSAGTNRDRN
jgi:hypothetical protein